MHLSDFDFELPAELIAQHPSVERTASRLLHVAHGALADLRFDALPGLLAPGDLLVLNDTRVLRARLRGAKASGGRVEVLVERVTGEREALAQLRASKPPRPGTRLLLGSAGAEVLERDGEFWLLRFDAPVLDVLEREGMLPLPPYITHAPDAEDERRYQTVYARDAGSVAAPTAGLHLTDDVLARCRAKGVAVVTVELVVGLGTFRPITADRVEDHPMHGEAYRIPAATVAAIEGAEGDVVAVGTTVVRALESWAETGETDATTHLFIHGDRPFAVVDRLLTNFHVPRSSLLALVQAFVGLRWKDRYAEARDQGYRFLSFGDATLLTP